MDMDPHLLRTFVAVARCGSLSQAARELGYTQSAVSQHIAALESDLGAVLLQRRPVSPTGVGVRLLEHAGPLLLRLDAARADIARLTAVPAARIVIGVSPLAMTPQLTGTLADMRQKQPLWEVTVRVLGRAAITREVSGAALDIGLVDGMAAPNDPLHLPDVGPLTAMAITEQPLALALPAQHPLAGRVSLRLVDLADARWIDAPDTAIPLAQLRIASGTGGTGHPCDTKEPTCADSSPSPLPDRDSHYCPSQRSPTRPASTRSPSPHHDWYTAPRPCTAARWTVPLRSSPQPSRRPPNDRDEVPHHRAGPLLAARHSDSSHTRLHH
jgi:molybdate transport repressor ModE-like protein